MDEFEAFMDKYDWNDPIWSRLDGIIEDNINNIFKYGIQTINYDDTEQKSGDINCQKCVLRMIEILENVQTISNTNKLALIENEKSNENRSEIQILDINGEVQSGPRVNSFTWLLTI